MNIGVIFPQTELGGDAGAVRAYGEGIRDLGFHHIGIYDHVVGADTTVHANWNGPYDLKSTFHEPFVVFGFLAAVADVELVTEVIILPQRQTVLVAKQAAEVDLLTNGRFRLGVGVGWNTVEYEALGKEFGDRGKRLDEQVELLRRLWTEDSVTHHGSFEHVTGAGIAPAPIQRPIPVWFGGRTPAAYERVGRTGDGWFPMVTPGPKLDAAKAIVNAAAAAAGRDPSAIGMDAQVSWRPDATEATLLLAQKWRDAGASHLSVNTMGSGLTTVDQHLHALGLAAEAMGVARR